MSCGAKNILITGRPGVGKTTVVIRLSEILRTRKIAGFYTEEIRQGSSRVGFRAVTFSGGETVMSHVSFPGRRRVGRYGVDVAAFEALVLPEISRAQDLLLIDEIGKMECFSERLVAGVRESLNSNLPVVATISLHGGGLIAEAKERPDVELHEVTHANRDSLVPLLMERLTRLLSISDS